VAWGLGFIHELGHAVANVTTGGDFGTIDNVKSFFLLAHARYNTVTEVGFLPVWIAAGPLVSIVSGVLIAEWAAYQKSCDRRQRYKKWKVVGLVGLAYAFKDLAYGFLPATYGFIDGGDGYRLHQWFEDNGLAPTIELNGLSGLADTFLPDVIVLNPLYAVFFVGFLLLTWEAYSYLKGTPLMCDRCKI
jgi:hypothetical protein